MLPDVLADMQRGEQVQQVLDAAALSNMEFLLLPVLLLGPSAYAVMN